MPSNENASKHLVSISIFFFIRQLSVQIFLISCVHKLFSWAMLVDEIGQANDANMIFWWWYLYIVFCGNVYIRP